MCEQDISRMRRQLDETNDELTQIARERDILAHENDNLQEQFSKAKQENQVYLFLDSFSPRKRYISSEAQTSFNFIEKLRLCWSQPLFNFIPQNIPHNFEMKFSDIKS